MYAEMVRNVAIIAHVDHGKTTLVDQLLYQSGMFRNEELDRLAGGEYGLIMDSNPIERERGITILSKNCAIQYFDTDGTEYKINIVDTPGHADFGGEVERVLKMTDGVLLIVDAFEGPMPQTRFVLTKALQHGLKPILVVNKADRADARPDDVVNEVFDLFVDLEADDEALDFPVLFASAKEGWATADLAKPSNNLKPVYDAIIRSVPAPRVDPDRPLQMLVTTLEYSDYVGRVAIGKVFAGRLRQAQSVTVIDKAGRHTQQKVVQLYEFEGLGKKRALEVRAGDICAVAGLDPVDIGDTIACPDEPSALRVVAIDEPTMSMTFHVNNGPFAGREGKYVTSLHLRDRLYKELQTNVALRVEPGESADAYVVSGRGLMHLGILLENMRREGYEVCVGKPEVIIKMVKGYRQEPIERLVIECPAECQSAVMSLIGNRRSEMIKMDSKSGVNDYVHMEFMIPSRGLFGLNARILTATQGRAVMHHTFERYEPMRGSIPQRQAGVMIATETGTVTAYALDALYDRGVFFVRPGDEVYEGQVVGEHCKDNDIPVNPAKTKQLTNMRTSSKDDAARVRPARLMSLEVSLEYIQQDELVEVCPKSIRIRKRFLKEADRRRAARREG
ncbi:MAG: translational GTPase TypA [Sedimentisphaerales bacterium]|mgnify:FL=1|jgi:GTP-binding protein|nr:translational GTPase TypA [Sedimentisphaerales bacterium]NLZ04555.1 translational GTPase TypA [Phycisphaerae bacterium]HNY78368.1 translational GTPase TypA [Sedimentisphaerales bacterium]HOC63544.1 translational GTPase TypA [Sedimentisphaerales bacterium]HOH62835.1 translational GTPase TypA [Sedimentisphaerales bacterium]